MLEAQSQDSVTRLQAEVDRLPSCPSVIRYWDPFANKLRTINEGCDSTFWTVTTNGAAFRLDFDGIAAPFLRVLMRGWAAWALQSLAPSTVRNYLRSLCHMEKQLGASAIAELLTAQPHKIAKIWRLTLISKYSAVWLTPVKSLLVYCCEMSIGELAPYYIDFIGAFRLPPSARSYAAVRSGRVFLSAQEETAIIAHLDEVNTKLKSGVQSIDLEELRAACVLAISYQYAMRPIQIAQARRSDVRLYQVNNDTNPPAVHITFLKAKQRSMGKQLPMTRKIKREWCPIFTRVLAERSNNPALLSREGALQDSFLGLNPSQVSNIIQATTERVTGRPVSANQLRHTAAQRLVDAGATKEELAEFMGHSSYKTGLVYFDISSTQAERVNKALALSPVYRAVAEVARTRRIDKEALLERPRDQQIGGVPHGIPIAGIGACDLGQSLCNKNPVLACYTCPKFLPVSDDTVHRKTVDSLRSVVKLFHDASRGENQSPAFMQLRQTLAAAERLISESGETDENGRGSHD